MLLFSVVVLAALSAMPLWLMYRALKTGVWNGRGVDVFRDQRPTAFWFGIVMYAAIAATIFIGGGYFAWEALR